VPFNAQAAKRVPGAYHGLQLVKNADRVANIANDVIGDITTTVSGALGISIVAQIVRQNPHSDQFWLNVLLTALISVVIVTGKACGKRYSLRHPDQIIFFLGSFMAKLENLTSFRFFKGDGSKVRPKDKVVK
jgi:hypothetical protein